MSEYVKYASLIVILGSNIIVWLDALGYFYVYEHCLSSKEVTYHVVMILITAVCLILWLIVNKGTSKHEQ